MYKEKDNSEIARGEQQEEGGGGRSAVTSCEGVVHNASHKGGPLDGTLVSETGLGRPKRGGGAWFLVNYHHIVPQENIWTANCQGAQLLQEQNGL